MTTLNIGGQRVKVDDKFVTLSPDQQQAIVEQIAASLADRLGPTREQRRAALIASNPAEYDPDSPEFQAKYGAIAGMGTIDKLRAGAGKAFADTGRAVMQLIPGNSEEERRQVALARERDEALMSTKAGLAGNIVGNVALTAPAVLVPGAATVPGAAITGAAIGALQPVTETGERVGNVAVGGALGGASQKIFNASGEALSRYLSGRQIAKRTEQIERLRSQAESQMSWATHPEVLAAEEEIARLAANPEAAARAAKARKIGVDLTPGQAERNLTLQGREIALARGTEGEQASIVAREGFERQQAQLQKAAQDIRDRFGGRVSERGQGAEAAGEAIRSRARAMKSAINQAYEEARGTSAFARPANVRGLMEDARARLLDDGFDIMDMPAVQRRLSELDELQNFATMAAQKNRKPGEIPLNQLEQWRKRITAAIGEGPRTPQDAALIQLKRHYDRWISDQLDRDLLSGSEEALSKWKSARALRTRYGELFESERAIENIIRKDPTPEEMKNWLVGASSIGAKAQAGRIARKVAEIVGKKSPAWKALQEEVFLDLLADQPATGFSAQKFVTAFNKFSAKNPTLVREIFSQGDLAAIRQLRDVAEMTIPMPGTVNYSNTAYTVLRELRPKAAVLLQRLTPLLDRAKHALNEVEARRTFDSIYRPPPRLMFEPRPVAAPAVAAGAALVDPGE